MNLGGISVAMGWLALGCGVPPFGLVIPNGSQPNELVPLSSENDTHLAQHTGGFPDRPGMTKIIEI